MQKDEERKQAQADQKAMEEWRLCTAEGYKDSGRAARGADGHPADTRAWENEKTRAPESVPTWLPAHPSRPRMPTWSSTPRTGTPSPPTPRPWEAQETDAEKEGVALAPTTTPAGPPRWWRDPAKLDPMLKEQIDSLDKEIERRPPPSTTPARSRNGLARRTRSAWRRSCPPSSCAAKALRTRHQGGRAAGRGRPSGHAWRTLAIRLGGPSRAGRQARCAHPAGRQRLSDDLHPGVRRPRHRQQAKTPEEIERAETDLQRIREEAKRVGVTIGRAPAAPAPRPAAAPRSVHDHRWRSSGRRGQLRSRAVWATSRASTMPAG